MIFIYCAGKYSAEIHDLITRLGFNKRDIAYVDDSKTVLDELSYKANIFTFEKLISIWDNNEKTLFLIRDRYGIKPLYYAQLGETILFGSEQKAILQHPIVKKEIDKKEVFRTMSDMGREMIISGDLNFREFDRVLSMD